MALIRGPADAPVRPHVQAFADACERATGAKSYGTYHGHSPSVDLALDIFTPVPSDRRAPGTPGLKRVLGDDIVDFGLSVFDEFGIDYIIWRQHIWNPEIARRWRLMGDRKSITANHFDHPHFSFVVKAGMVISPHVPTPEGGIPTVTIFYVWSGQDWVFCPTSRVHGRLPFPDTQTTLITSKIVRQLGPQSGNFHAGLVAWANAAGFAEIYHDDR